MSSVTTVGCADQLIGELSSTLGASSLKNFSAVSGSHSLSETVLFFSLSLLGLVCSLHDSHLLVKIRLTSGQNAPFFAYSYESRIHYILKYAFCQVIFEKFYYFNVLINKDFAFTVNRQFFYSGYCILKSKEKGDIPMFNII